MAKAFASTGDMEEKTISFTEVGPDLYAFTAEGDPNTGVIIGDDGVMVVDTQATPVMAQEVVRRIREVTDKPVKYVVLSHYHAVRVLGASAYQAEQVIASDACRAMIHERGQEDWDSEFGRFPRLFQDADSIPGLTWPTMTFKRSMTVYLGRRRVDLMHLGRATPPATSSPGCRTRASCSRATRSSSIPPAIAATGISTTGPARWTQSARSSLARWRRAAATRWSVPTKCAKRWR